MILVTYKSDVHSYRIVLGQYLCRPAKTSVPVGVGRYETINIVQQSARVVRIPLDDLGRDHQQFVRPTPGVGDGAGDALHIGGVQPGQRSDNVLQRPVLGIWRFGARAKKSACRVCRNASPGAAHLAPSHRPVASG